MISETESNIDVAIAGVELLGANEKLTEAIMLLSKAREIVSDYIDGQINECELSSNN